MAKIHQGKKRGGWRDVKTIWTLMQTPSERVNQLGVQVHIIEGLLEALSRGGFQVRKWDSFALAIKQSLIGLVHIG